MRKYNPYKNIFYDYRGRSNKRKDGEGDRQIEDNTTKALINTIENSKRGLLEHFLKHLRIKPRNFHNVSYDLQIAEEKSRPDALIQVGSLKIFIESKIDCPLEENQIIKHLESISNGHLICITPRLGDLHKIERIGDGRIKFITWKDVYLCFQGYLKTAIDDKANFVINEFVNYLEAINMAPFYGWHKSHFEAFLNIEDDPKNELRTKVKEDLGQYLTELKEHLQRSSLFKDLQKDVGKLQAGNLQAGVPPHCWGVLCTPPPKSRVHKPHFNFVINADEFVVGVQIEGQKPANKFKKTVQKNELEFLKILGHLEGFDLIIRERINPDNRPRGHFGIPVAQIALGDNVSQHDIEFISKKMDQYKLFEVSCSKAFKRDDEFIRNASFLTTSADLMKQLQPYYEFSKS